MSFKKALVMADTEWYATLQHYFSQHNLNGEQILTNAGLSPSTKLDQPPQYYSVAVANAFRAAAVQSRNQESGLRPYPALSHLGVLSHAILAASTVEKALAQAARYIHLYWPIANIEMLSGSERGVIRLRLGSGQEDIPAEMYDFFICGIINALKTITGSPPHMLQVCRLGPVPADKTPWQKAFGCEVLFNASECTITLDRAYIEHALPTANSTIFDFCTKMLQQIAEQRGYTIKAKIRAILPAHLALGKVRREEIASRLDISERTLCRRIASEGTTFSSLVDELRRDMAESYIKQGYSPTETAYSIGFSDPSNFYRACKRWFGAAPAHLSQTAIG